MAPICRVGAWVRYPGYVGTPGWCRWQSWARRSAARLWTGLGVLPLCVAACPQPCTEQYAAPWQSRARNPTPAPRNPGPSTRVPGSSARNPGSCSAKSRPPARESQHREIPVPVPRNPDPSTRVPGSSTRNPGSSAARSRSQHCEFAVGGTRVAGRSAVKSWVGGAVVGCGGDLGGGARRRRVGGRIGWCRGRNSGLGRLGGCRGCRVRRWCRFPRRGSGRRRGRWRGGGRSRWRCGRLGRR
jgi:hypothetical protein